MKIKKILSIILSAIMLVSALAACSPTDSTVTTVTDENGNVITPSTDGVTVSGGSVKFKFLKTGRSTCIVIRTPAGNVMIDTAADDKSDKIIEYLAEKSIDKIDYLIITNYSKKHIGGMEGILSSGKVTIKNVLAPAYAKSSSTYTAFESALTSAGLSITKVSENTELTLGGVKLNIYAPHKDYSTSEDENDEQNSLAVSLDYDGCSFLMTSRIKGERTAELISDLAGKTFDLITVPNYGIYDSSYDTLFTALSAKQAVAFCSNNADKTQMDVKTINLLTAASTSVYATRDGSIEVKIKDGALTVNGTAIN